MEKEKVVIIGAGPAGLTAAYELAALDKYEVIVFEETDRLGGISCTIRHNGNRMDIGGHRFFSKNEQVMQWWRNILPMQGAPAADDRLLAPERIYPSEGPDPEQADRVMLERRRVSRIFYLRKFFDYPISLRTETFTNMGLARTVKAGFGYVASAMHKRPENSLEDFYINRFGAPLYRMFFEHYTEKVWGIHPSRLGADWGSQRVKGLSLMKVLGDVASRPFRRDGQARETSLIERFIYPKYGPGQLWETVAADAAARGVRIETESPVVGIEVSGGRVVAVTTRRDGVEKTDPCDYLVSSMPVKDLVAALHGIEVPAEVARIARELPYRDFITVGLLVDKLLITNKTKLKTVGNIVPDTWIYIQEPDVKIGRLQVFNNWSPYLVKDFGKKVWIGLEYFCSEGDELWEMDDKAFIDLAVDELSRIGIVDKADVQDAVRVKVRKAYPSYYGSYYELDRVIAFLDGIENLYCVGRNGQHRYNNMDHSMLTAMEAVQHLAGRTSDKSLIWKVNTEKDYHESK